VTSDELDRMKTLLHERLRSIVNNPKAAYDALWTSIDKLGARLDSNNLTMSPQHRLTKEDIKIILQEAGAILTPTMSLVDVRKSFTKTSAIGRTWQRNISGQYISSPVVSEIIAAIDARKRSILLTGLPGSGKTCVMLAVQEVLEQRMHKQGDLVPLFIQAREYADMDTAQERQAKGLSEQWVEQAARMAEEAYVIVVIDSLDVLSIAREHNVLSYFLAQIDLLLLIPNITLVTACRDFDRQYDRRIAERQWDCEFNCPLLNWDSEITPLLDVLGIHTGNIDTVTRDLIRNPRELALFVELAQREGSFNVVTSQALAQRYLDIIVRANNRLGETAMHAIEDIADEMLKSRSLAIPHQRFNASQDIQRTLCSLNVLQESQDGKLIFGHQTLLDVLVISRAVRQGISLSQFIQSLPPVPFVRPSIRSFIAQLATGERSNFRKQLRTVLTGNSAFHIRRLVAESFAEQIPQDDDWSLIRDLHNKHRDVFQVIYTQAVQVEWHYFWFRYLIPVLIETQDANGIATHVHKVSLWKNDDATGVLQFWMKALSMTWLDCEGIANQLSYYLSEMNTENLSLVAPLLELLLSMPRQQHDLLGSVVAHCIDAGVVDDNLLWGYVAGDISDDDAIRYHLDNKLRCQPHEFGNKNDNFFCQRMEQSTTLLDLALESIEHWSGVKSLRNGKTRTGYRNGLLDETSYKKPHTKSNTRHVDAENILLDSIEAAILSHAKTHSSWWKNNRERLCFNHEGALVYFAILACISSPRANIDLIGRMLRDKNLLEFRLIYELGTLIHTAYRYLDLTTQDAVTACIVSTWDDVITDESHHLWALKNRAELITSIPCYLRSSNAQALLNAYERKEDVLIREPKIQSWGGFVSAPFSFEIFLSSDDRGVLRLLAHYSEQGRDFDDFLVGGEREVGWQLREASSRHPKRFLKLLSTQWANISESFCNDIMDGTANYLEHRYGNLQANNTWLPIDEPDANTLAVHILDELEMHPSHWYHNHTASNALRACSYVLQDTQNAARLVFMAIGFANFPEKNLIQEDSDGMFSTGLNMTSGHIAESLMILANRFEEDSIQFPELLSPTLQRFSGHWHPAIRSMILQRLPYLQSKNSLLGWELFKRAMHEAAGLWQTAERCLYYAYRNNFEKVAPLLNRIHSENNAKDKETWGRISALSAFSNKIDFNILLEDLKRIKVTEAWQGAVSVWTNSENIQQYREQCLAGIKAGLNTNSAHAKATAQKMEKIFRDKTPVISIPIELVRLFFTALDNNDDGKHNSLFWFGSWLNATAHRDPEQAIAATEFFVTYTKHVKMHLFDHKNNLTQLITRLFAEAEEREESDNGEMLKRVVLIQDSLLSLGLDSINTWLKAAERP
jgi:Cdc6-like AAA superfamily ATPase